MFSCYLFPFILLFSTSSMFELHVVVTSFVMFNIMELIMEIVPNYLTTHRLRLDVCIGKLGIALSGIPISWDIHIEINANIFVWMCRHLVP
jgi:hypothetical protein